MSRDLYKRYWNDTMVTRFFVEAVHGSDLARVRARIEDALRTREDPWRVISSGDLVAYWGTQIRRAFASVYVLAAVILAVILFGIADNLSAGVLERTRELGTLRALGIRRQRLRRMVVAEALVIASIGLTLAFAEGFAIAAVWIHATIPYLLGWVMEVSVPVGVVVFVRVVTLAGCGRDTPTWSGARRGSTQPPH
jgi:putative ABC transport system permease protein